MKPLILLGALVLLSAGCATHVEERQLSVAERNDGAERGTVEKQKFVWPWWAPTFRP